MMHLVLAAFLLVLCGGETHSAESPTAHGECEVHVAGTEATSAQVLPVAVAARGFVCATIDMPLVSLSGRRDVTGQARAPAGEHSAVSLRSPPPA